MSSLVAVGWEVNETGKSSRLIDPVETVRAVAPDALAKPHEQRPARPPKPGIDEKPAGPIRAFPPRPMQGKRNRNWPAAIAVEAPGTSGAAGVLSLRDHGRSCPCHDGSRGMDGEDIMKTMTGNLEVRMLTAGILGGVASGKSTVSGKLQSLGASLVRADEIGHQVLKDPELIRPAIAEHVFASGVSPESDARAARERMFWESQTHPRITRQVVEQLAQLRQFADRSPDGSDRINYTGGAGHGGRIGRESVVVLDAALLLEAGWERFCDVLLFVDAPRSLRLERAMLRGWSAEHFAAREAAQLSVEEKREKASVVIDNSGTMDQTYKQVLQFWDGLSR